MAPNNIGSSDFNDINRNKFNKIIEIKNLTLGVLKDFSDYLNTNEQHLRDLQDEFSTKTVKREKRIGIVVHDGVAREENISWDQFAAPVSRFSDTLRQSFTVLLYSLVEGYLIVLCGALSKPGSAKSFNDIKKEEKAQKAQTVQIIRISKYLEILGINFKDLPQWNEINNLRKLRNHIVHNNGGADKDSNDYDSLMRYIANNRFLSTGHEDKIVIDMGYCEATLTTIQQFILALYSRISVFIDQNKVNVESIDLKYQYADDPYLAINHGRLLDTIILPGYDEDRDIQKGLHDLEEQIKKEMDTAKKPKKSSL